MVSKSNEMRIIADVIRKAIRLRADLRHVFNVFNNNNNPYTGAYIMRGDLIHFSQLNGSRHCSVFFL